MSADGNYKKLKVTPGGFIAPIVTVALLVVFWRLGQKWVAAPALIFLILLYLVLPRIVRARARAFHRRALALLASGKADQVPALAKKQLLLQLFAPSSPIDAKLGLAYAQMERFAAAVDCLENAVTDAPESEQPALQAALAKSLLVIGAAGRAEITGRAIISRGIELPEVLAITARARVGTGKLDDETNELLDRALAISPGGDVALMVHLTRIEAALLSGRRPGELPEGADSEQRFMRVWIHQVRGMLRERRGDPEAAMESYSKAIKEAGDQRSVFLDAAHGRMERLGRNKRTSSGDAVTSQEIPALKKKKRR